MMNIHIHFHILWILRHVQWWISRFFIQICAMMVVAIVSKISRRFLIFFLLQGITRMKMDWSRTGLKVWPPDQNSLLVNSNDTVPMNMSFILKNNNNVLSLFESPSQKFSWFVTINIYRIASTILQVLDAISVLLVSMAMLPKERVMTASRVDAPSISYLTSKKNFIFIHFLIAIRVLICITNEQANRQRRYIFLIGWKMLTTYVPVLL